MNKKPSILMINRVYPPQRGATGRMMQNLAHGLKQSGWSVTIVTTEDPKLNYSQSAKVKKIFVKRAKNPKTAIGCLTNLRRLYKSAMKAPRHDVVLTMTDPPMLACIGAKIAKKKKSKHIHWSQDVYPDLFPSLGINLPKFLYNYLHKRSVRAMNSADQVVAIGRCMENYLKHHGVVAGKITFIPNWADFEVLVPSKKTNNLNIYLPEGIAKKPEEMFRDNSPKFRVLYAGNIGRAHSVKTIVDAAEILAPNQEIEFVFVGDSAGQNYIAQERARRGLDNIKFLPYQPLEKLREVMESGDVHLVTMRPKVKGMLVPCKFYSSLSAGRPILNVGPMGSEISNIIEEYRAGITIDPNDPKALADAIYNYRTDGDLWFQTQEGALRASQAFHPNGSIQKWVELLTKIRVS